MVRQATIAEIRFGYGLGPQPGATDAEDILARFARGDQVKNGYDLPNLRDALTRIRDYRALDKQVKSGEVDPEMRREARRDLERTFARGFRAAFARIMDTEDVFRERLVAFWADHFTAVPKNLVMRGAAPAYLEVAIRPHVGARFADMLKAVVTHPFMLSYLDQAASAGPNSRAGQRRGAGLNENLAREVLELHTLGVGGAYTQADVRQLSELMTGLSIDPRKGFVYRPQMAEPGTETVLGKRYGGQTGRLDNVMAVMEDLAVHPDTANHLARKLVAHFVADDPDPDLVAHVAAAYRASDGALGPVYEALLEHPASWGPLGQKVKPPIDFMASSLKAFGATGRDIMKMPERDLRTAIARPLRVMGQPFMGARGPDGWPEAADHWITPQGLALRIAWAKGAADRLATRIEDPRRFLEDTLADAAGQRLKFAVGAAETKAEGAVLVLASAEFNRR